MPLVQICITGVFEEALKRSARTAQFYSDIREALSILVNIDQSRIGVTPGKYAPGCESGRPAVLVHVSLGGDMDTARHTELTESLVQDVKSIADRAAKKDVGKVKAVIDLACRKVATSKEAT